MPKTAPCAWAAARAAYSAGAMTVPEITAAYGMGRTTLYRRMKQEAWTPPDEAAKLPSSKSSSGAPQGQTSYAERLRYLLDKTLVELELSLLAGGVRTTPERERDVRTLASLVRVIEKLDAIEPNTERAREAGQTEADDDRMRAEIADRLARLRRRRNGTTAGPGERPLSQGPLS